MTNQSVLILTDIYNYLPDLSPNTSHLSLPFLTEFRIIQSLLNSLIHNDDDPKHIYDQIQLSLIEQEKVLGPKKFKTLILNISNATIQYVTLKIRKGDIQRAVLCLTYFQRMSNRYLTTALKILVSLTFCLAQYSKRTYKTMRTYLLQTSQLLSLQQKHHRIESMTEDLQILSSLFIGIYNIEVGHLTKAKGVFNEIVSKTTTRIHQEQLKLKRTQSSTANFIILATYFLSLTYKSLGDNGLSNYNLTQSLQFASHHLPQPEPLIQHFQQHMHIQHKTIKLSRIQNKIENIKSLHFNNLAQSLSKKQPGQFPQLHVKIQTKKHSKAATQNLNQQLGNLFTLEEPKAFILKKRTLNSLHHQSKTRLNRIQYNQLQIDTFHHQKNHIDHAYQLRQREEQFIQQAEKKIDLRAEIASDIWGVVGSLKPTHKIKRYLLGFKMVISYETSNKFYRFLCSNVSLMGHLAFFKMISRFKTKLTRQYIRGVKLNKLKHQIQFLRHRINDTRHIKVYNIQSGNGVDDQLEVDAKLYQKLKTSSLELHFSIKGRKLVPLETFLETLGFSTLCQVKLFIVKLKQKVLLRKELLSFQKRQVYISFNQSNTDLAYTLFLTTRLLPEGLYFHKIQRIDCRQHHNPDYNINFRQTIVNGCKQFDDNQLDFLLTEYILRAKQSHTKLITRIQTMFRRKLSNNTLRARREGVSVFTTKINDNLFTLVVRGHIKTFFIEHLCKQYPTVILNKVNFNSLAFVNKLRQQLMSTQDCQQHLQTIQKYFKIRQIYYKLTKRSKQLQLQNNFSTKFRISLCFARKSKFILYKGKKVQANAMYMLTVKDFQTYPRLYLLRAFNLDAESLYSFDIELHIHMAEKLFLENNLDRLFESIDIMGHKLAHLMIDGPAKSNPKSKRGNSKSTILSNYSFCSKQQFTKEVPRNRMVTRLQSRVSCLPRNKRNSIHFKMRHKSALKQKDVLLIKKWIENCKQNFDVSQESQASN